MALIKKIPSSVIKYLSVGVVSVTVDYGLLLLFYRVLGIPLETATATAFIVGLVVNFVLNRMWSFNAKPGRDNAIRQGVLYGILVLLNTVFTVLVVGSVSSYWNIPPEISKPVCVLLTTAWNYILYKKIIFKE